MEKNITSTLNEEEQHLRSDATKDFKIILIFVSVILVIFLAFFIYNMIKCYLPKWKKQSNKYESAHEEGNVIRKIEFEEI